MSRFDVARPGFIPRRSPVGLSHFIHVGFVELVFRRSIFEGSDFGRINVMKVYRTQVKEICPSVPDPNVITFRSYRRFSTLCFFPKTKKMGHSRHPSSTSFSYIANLKKEKGGHFDNIFERVTHSNSDCPFFNEYVRSRENSFLSGSSSPRELLAARNNRKSHRRGPLGSRRGEDAQRF